MSFNDLLQSLRLPLRLHGRVEVAKGLFTDSLESSAVVHSWGLEQGVEYAAKELGASAAVLPDCVVFQSEHHAMTIEELRAKLDGLKSGETLVLADAELADIQPPHDRPYDPTWSPEGFLVEYLKAASIHHRYFPDSRQHHIGRSDDDVTNLMRMEDDHTAWMVSQWDTIKPSGLKWSK